MSISLEDLHSAETKGKWWLVGAAWNGDPLIEKHAEFAKSTFAVQPPDDQPSESADLVKLARSQGMNTEIRRGIFVVLMSSDVIRLPACWHKTDRTAFILRTTLTRAKDFLS